MKYKYLDEINSTNSYCKTNIDVLADKSVVYTSKQSGGRGRFNRVWIDLGSENIFLSIVLKPSESLLPVFSNLTQYTALKLAEVFSDWGVSPNIKWPNDILISGKKISGILAETVLKENKLKGIIIGVGLNLNANEKDFVQVDKLVTALNIELAHKIDKEKFLKQFIEKFFEGYENFLNEGFISIKNEYEKYIDFIGKDITINNLNEKVSGIVEKITNDGAIVINGEKFFTGDII